MAWHRGTWVGGLAEWVEGDTAFLSIAFTWKLDEAYQRALWFKSLGMKVRAGGPATFTRKHHLADVAEIGGTIPDALQRHNPMATKASEGCPVGCWRSEEHTSELQSLMRISYAVFCLKKNKKHKTT